MGPGPELSAEQAQRRRRESRRERKHWLAETAGEAPGYSATGHWGIEYSQRLHGARSPTPHASGKLGVGASLFDTSQSPKEFTLPRPTLSEAVSDVRRLHGSDVLLRLAWSGEASVVFHVITGAQIVAYLKVGKNLALERGRLEWLDGKLAVPNVLSFGSTDDADWLVTSPLEGLDLSNLKHTEPPARIARWMADALRTVHAVPADDCPFGAKGPGALLTHGDACLPNFLFSRGTLSGVVDVGDSGLSQPAVDLASAVWSLQYNLGAGHGAVLLDAYGIDLDAAGLRLATDNNGEECLQQQ